MTTVYLIAAAFGVTLLLASLVLGGDDADADADADADVDGEADGHGGAAGGSLALAWAPVFSLRFWVFMLGFGGSAGYALTRLGSSAAVAGVGAVGIGWVAGAAAVLIMTRLRKGSISSGIHSQDLVGSTGKLVLPVGHGKPGKVRIDVKGRAEDYVANLVEDHEELPSGTSVLIIAEGERGSLLVAKGEM